jgi:5,10-methylene-tetrahydrofolate dehydrogenase/methenyl tetrahydrofolate cyclohydrolase
MTGSKIDGTAIAKSIRERLGSQIKQRQEANPRYKPSLKIVQGESPAIHSGYRDTEANGSCTQSATAPTRRRMCA